MRWFERAREASSLDELADKTLPMLKVQLKGEAAVLVVGSIGAPTFVAGDVARLDPGVYFAEFAEADPLQRYGRRCPDRVFTGSASVPRDELVASRAYREYYAPRRLGDVIAAGLVSGDFLSSAMTSIACFRSDVEGPYGRADVKRFDAGLTELGRAVARCRPQPVVGASPELMLEAVVRFLGDRSLLVLDAAGRVMWVSARARELLGDRFEPPRDLVVAARAAAERPQVASQVASFRLAAHRVSLNVVRCRDLPLIVAELILAERLSAAETRVFEAMGHGLSNGEIAELLHLSVATVKTHAHRIFQKLGVRSRVEAALLARGRAG